MTLITNDDVAKRAMELATADGSIVWQKEVYIVKATKQLELEAEENRLKKTVTSISTPAELVAAIKAADEHLAKRAARCA